VIGELDHEPEPELRVSLYRVVQEAVANARKHAGARHVSVRVRTAGDGVTVLVSDDGAGFDTGGVETPVPGHLGLATMIERAELIGGWCRVSSAADSGTTVECWLPDDGEGAADGTRDSIDG
jgi:signal transduction histidine kinase